MTFDILSGATTIGHQKPHNSLLNSNISKLIHDQGKGLKPKGLKGSEFLKYPELWQLRICDPGVSRWAIQDGLKNIYMYHVKSYAFDFERME